MRRIRKRGRVRTDDGRVKEEGEKEGGGGRGRMEKKRKKE